MIETLILDGPPVTIIARAVICQMENIQTGIETGTKTESGKETGIRIVPVIMTGTVRELGTGIETGTESGKETEREIGGMNMIEDPEMAMKGLWRSEHEVHHRGKGSSRHSRSRSRSRSRSQSIHGRSGHDQNRENASASSNLAKLKDIYGDLNNQKEDAGKDRGPKRPSGTEEVIRLGGSTWR